MKIRSFFSRAFRSCRPMGAACRRVICFCLVLICLSAGLSAYAADADTAFAYLEPKFIHAEGQLAPIYDTELASFLRTASSEAYDVGKEDSNEGAGLSPVFGDIQLFSVEDSSIKLYKTGPDGEELRSDLRITCHFLTAAKRFTVNGEEKNVILISFRGSAELYDWFIDGQIADNDGFHKGFLGCADLAYETLVNEVSYPALDGESFASVLEKAKDPSSGYYILVTGHSLGGAVANILTCRHLNRTTLNPLNTLCYTFAAPKVCHPEVADLYYSSNIINIKNTTDVVTHIGYLLTVGVTPGYTISATTTETKEVWYDILMQHSIGVVYKDILYQVNAAPEVFYPYLTRTKAAPQELVVTCWSNYFEGDTFVDNFIPPAIADRFFGHEIVIDGGSLGVYNGACLPTIIVRDNGSLTCSNDAKNRVAGDVIVESGSLTTDSGKLKIDGDLRLQTRTASGKYTGGSGQLIMQHDAGYLTVYGDFLYQGSDSNFLYRRDMTAGTLEVKGDFSVLANQQVSLFSPGGTHRVLLSGTTPQTITFLPFADESYNFSSFNILESTNPHPLKAPQPLSFEYLRHDLTFDGDLTLDYIGGMTVDSDVVLTADNIFLLEGACLNVCADLTIQSNLSGGRVDVGEYQGEKGAVTVAGDLLGTDLYFNVSEEPGVVEIRGDYLNNNADLVLCDGQLIVRGDFRYQTQLEDGSFAAANDPFASVYEGAQLQIDGDLYLQGETNEDFGFPEALLCMLKGDLIQICDETNEDFWNYGLRNLVLAGETQQTINAPRLYFDNLTLANTSAEGVSFLHELYGISGIFNAYGRADGTITPYRFPEDCTPPWKDSDGDSIPDCLDPQPQAEADYAALPAALGDGTQEGETVRFLYAPTAEQMPENTVVWVALYADGQLFELRPVTLNMTPAHIHALDIDLTGQSAIDAVKVFQVDTGGYSPLWFAANWAAPQ